MHGSARNVSKPILEASAAELKHNPTIAVCRGQPSPVPLKVVQLELGPSVVICQIGAGLVLLIYGFPEIPVPPRDAGLLVPPLTLSQPGLDRLSVRPLI